MKVVIAAAALAGLMAGCVATPDEQASLTTSLTSKGQSGAAEGGEGASESAVASLRANAYRKVGKAYEIAGRVYKPKHEDEYERTGTASWYGDAFHGKLTANGEVFDMAMLTAAHPTLPLPSYVRVTNLANDRSVIVRVNDRGPFHSDRLIDVSKRAAEVLDFKHAGMAKVKVEYVEHAPLKEDDTQFLLASYRGPELPSAPDPADAAANIMVAYAPEAEPGATALDEAFDGPVDSEKVASGTPFDPAAALGASAQLAAAEEARPSAQPASFTLPQPAPRRLALRSSYVPEERVNAAFAALDEFAAQPSTAFGEAEQNRLKRLASR